MQNLNKRGFDDFSIECLEHYLTELKEIRFQTFFFESIMLKNKQIDLEQYLDKRKGENFV
jgi:hypothetical protein